METADRYTEWLEGFKHLIYRQKKMKQTELAKKTGAGEQHVNAILKGRRKAGTDLQDAISAALGMSYDQVRDLGACLLSGADGESVLRSLRTIASHEATALRRVPGPHVRLPFSGEEVRVVGPDGRFLPPGTIIRADGSFDERTNFAIDTLRRWWRRKFGDSTDSAANFVLELGRRFPEIQPPNWEAGIADGDGEAEG